ncbi:MAG: IS66 family transposase [Planctomycetota bacterium]
MTTIRRMNLAAAMATIADLTEQNEDLGRRNDELTERLVELEIKLARALKDLRRRSSEKLDPNELLEGCREFMIQQELDLLGEDADNEEDDNTEEEFETITRRKPRKRLSAEGLDKQEQEVPVPEDQCTCEHCGELMPVIGHDPVVKFGFRPEFLYALRFLLEKRACKCGKGIAKAKVPPHAIPRCKALPDLLAYVIVSKFMDGLPLHRQSKRFARHGLEVGDTTLGEWCRQTADVLAPVALVMLRQIRNEEYLQVDETSLRVQAKGGCEKGWLWAYGKPHDQVYFDFRPSRSRDGPAEVLEGFSGKIQSDGFSVYDRGIGDGELLRFACWAHTRRYFHEAKDKSKKRAGKILKFIQKLYRVEREARDGGLSAEQRRAHRQEHATPILDAIHSSLVAYSNEPNFLPKSELGRGVKYALRRWEGLTRYVEHGDVEIDNNLCENSMRLVAVTRKNFLFAGSEAGAERAALFFSLLESCRRLGINPHEYLTDVLTRLPEIQDGQFDQLTPKGWKAARAAEVVTSA